VRYSHQNHQVQKTALWPSQFPLFSRSSLTARRRHRASDDALAVASAGRTTAVAEDIRGLFPATSASASSSLRTLGHAGDACAFSRRSRPATSGPSWRCGAPNEIAAVPDAGPLAGLRSFGRSSNAKALTSLASSAAKRAKRHLRGPSVRRERRGTGGGRGNRPLMSSATAVVRPADATASASSEARCRRRRQSSSIG